MWKKLWEIVEPGNKGLLAGSVLLAGAALSSVSGITCAAMAETYARAIADFGVAAMCGGACFALLQTWPFAGRLFFFLGCLVFYLSVGVSAHNVQISVAYCAVGGSKEILEEHARTRIPLAGI